MFKQKGGLNAHRKRFHTLLGRQRQKKKEQALARFLEEAGIQFEREVTVHFCGEASKKFARVDFVCYQPYGVCAIELDEFQHEHYPVSCEAGRMLNILAEHAKRGEAAGKLHIIRLNPDAFSEAGRRRKVPLKRRHLELLKAIVVPPEHQFAVTYMCYNAAEPGGLPDTCHDPDYPEMLRAVSRGWHIQ
jgi:hypothetical protein